MQERKTTRPHTSVTTGGQMTWPAHKPRLESLAYRGVHREFRATRLIRHLESEHRTHNPTRLRHDPATLEMAFEELWRDGTPARHDHRHLHGGKHPPLEATGVATFQRIISVSGALDLDEREGAPERGRRSRPVRKRSLISSNSGSVTRSWGDSTCYDRRRSWGCVDDFKPLAAGWGSRRCCRWSRVRLHALRSDRPDRHLTDTDIWWWPNRP